MEEIVTFADGGESDNLSCLMNVSVPVKQVVSSDANVGRQLKFSTGNH